MPHSPLVSKIRCHNPNRKSSAVCNRNYLIYIATREGVDLTDTELKIENLEDGGMREESANDLYAKYIAERPRSHGLFGNIDCSDVNQVGNNLADLTSQGKAIYRGIVSLKEEDALELGYDKKENWVSFIRNTIPDVASTFNIPIDKLQWCAAVHMEKGHPHCHYMFWSSDDKVRSPYIHVSKQDKCRELLSKEMFKAEREQEVINKTLQRDLLLDMGKDFLEEHTERIGENESRIMGRISNDTLNSYGNKLLALSARLPQTGRLTYKFLQPHLKDKVDAFVDDILSQREMQKQYTAYLQTVDNISQTYSASRKHMETNRKIADEDIRKRLANVVLKRCRLLIREQDMLDKYADRAALLSEQEPDTSGQELQLPDTDASSDAESPVSNTEPYIEFPDMTAEPDTEFPDGGSGTDMELPDDAADPDMGLPEDGAEADFIYDYNAYKKALNLIYDPAARDIKAAVKILTLQSAQNNVPACMELGRLYASNLVPDVADETAKSLSQAYYHKAYQGLVKLEEKNPKASYEYKLGKLLEKGNGIPQDYEKARKYYELASSSGYKYAQYSLGCMYLHENVEKFTKENRGSLITKGLHYIKDAADQNFAYAAYTYAKTCESEALMDLSKDELHSYYSSALSGFSRMLEERRDDNLLYRIGTMHYAGQGTPANQETALEYFREAAKLNNANAQYALGKTYADPESGYYDIPEAIKYFESAEAQGNSFAQYELGKIYLDREGPCYDPDKGIEYLKKAAELDNVNAQYALGKAYADTESGHYDILEAVKYFKSAEARGNSFASYKLGKIYLDREGPCCDPDKGIEYLKEAAKLNNANAQYALGKIYADPESGYYNIPEAIKYFELAETQENAFAQYELGKIYLDREGPCYNPDKGIEYLKKAAELDNVNAQYALGKTYADPESGYYNITEAIQYLESAESQGNTFASYELGKIYVDYESPYYNPEKGLGYLNNAAASGNIYALAKIGNIYLWGKHPGIEKDVQRGLSLLQEAADNGNEYARTSIDIYEDIQDSAARNLAIRAGYGCFRAIFTSLVSSRRQQDAYAADAAFRSQSKAARRARMTQRGINLDKDAE